MDEPKRVPTEVEARLLLRETARKMEDEAAIADFARSIGRRPALPVLVVAALSGLGVFLYEPMRSPYGMMIFFLWLMFFVQGIIIGQLAKVTKALARTLERARREEPLPRAPSH